MRYVVWCGVQPGRVTLRIRRPHGSAVVGFSPIAKAAGPGASGPLRYSPDAPFEVVFARPAGSSGRP